MESKMKIPDWPWERTVILQKKKKKKEGMRRGMEEGMGLWCTVEKGIRINVVVGIFGHHFHCQKKSTQEASTTHLGG